jgi:hypothetical protein
MSRRKAAVDSWRAFASVLGIVVAPSACADDVTDAAAGSTDAAAAEAASTALPGDASVGTSTGGESGGGNATTSTTADASTTTTETGDEGSSSTDAARGSASSRTTTSGDTTTGDIGGNPFGVHFTDVTDLAGVGYVQGVTEISPNCLIDALGPGKNGFCNPERCIAGAAVGDYDADGDDDLFVTRTRATNLLFQNDGGTFTDVTAARGITEDGHSAGAAFGDVDNDGDLDLYVATIASYGHLLYINDGTGNFTEEGVARGASIDSGRIHIGMTPSFGDYDLDGYLDVYVGEWTIVAAMGEGPSHSRLLRNRGDEAPGTFEDVTIAAGVDIDGAWQHADGTSPGTYSFAAAFTDLDLDRYPELAIASDFGTSRLFWNNGDGTFTDRTDDVGAGLDRNGMGSAVADYDNDGDLDWYVTSITAEDEAHDNRLYRNTGQELLEDVAVAMGVGDNGWGWGATFFEADNDGDLDLLAVAGFYFSAYDDEPIKLWMNVGDLPMVDISDDVGFAAPRQRRGVLSWDYDDDGDQDVLMTSSADAPELYRNEHGSEADWLRVRVVGTTSNTDGIGARVYVRAELDGVQQMREIGSGSHFMGHGERTAHFGLGEGDDPVARVVVVWPASEAAQLFEDVARNQTLVVEEP